MFYPGFSRGRFLTAVLLTWILAGTIPPVAAQTGSPRTRTSGVAPSPAPTAAPSPEPPAPPAPAATPEPSPTPEVRLTVVPGALDGAMLEAHREARRPAASRVNLPGVAPDEAARELTPARQGGRHEPISLRGQALSGKAQPAAVALRFDPARAGANVWVHPVDGGTVDGKPDGRFLTLGSDGVLSFSFQTPLGRSDVFHVVVRLDNVETVLPFEVPDPDELKAARTANNR